MRKLWHVGFIVAVLLCVSSCSKHNTIPKQEPDWPDRSTLTQHLNSHTLTLYIPENAGVSVTTVNTSVRLLPYESTAEAAVKELLSTMNTQSYMSSISLISIACTDRTAIVNLTGDIHSYSDQQRFVLAYCIANTLHETGEVRYVNILVDDKALEYQGVMFGTLTRFDQDIETALWQFETEITKAKQIATPYNKLVTLYLGSSDTDYLVAHNQEISFISGQDTLAPIINALAKDSIAASKVRLLPSTTNIADYQFQKDEKTGEQHLFIRLQGGILPHLVRSGYTQSIVRASIAMTLFDFYPGISSISIAFDDEQPSEMLLRVNQELYIGTTMHVFYPCTQGGIVGIDRVVSTYERTSVERVLDLIFSAPSLVLHSEIDAELMQCVDRKDVLDIAISDTTALIEVTSNFTKALRRCAPSAQRDIIYCIVNTLCTTMDVSRVVFFENGIKCDYVEGLIDISDYLCFNSGIIRS